MAKKKRQPRLSTREFKFRNQLIIGCWRGFKDEFTMEEMARVFRMPLAQFYLIIKKHEEIK